MRLKISLLMTIILLVFNQLANGQNRIAKDAIKAGKNNELLYSAVSRANSFITTQDLDRWQRKHKRKFMIQEKELVTKWFAGCERTLISKFTFIEKSDFAGYSAIQNEKERQRILAEQERKNVDRAVSATGLAVFGAIVGSAAKGIKNHINNFGKFDTPQSDTSSEKIENENPQNTSEDIVNKTDNTEVDYKTIPIPEISSKSKWKDAGNGSSDEVCDVCYGKPLEDGFLCALLIRDKNKYYTRKNNFTELQYDTEEQALRALYILKRWDKIVKY